MTMDISGLLKMAWLEECAHIADNIAGQANCIDDPARAEGWREASQKIAAVIRQQKGDK